jgi:hypothetical protein
VAIHQQIHLLQLPLVVPGVELMESVRGCASGAASGPGYVREGPAAVPLAEELSYSSHSPARSHVHVHNKFTRSPIHTFTHSRVHTFTRLCTYCVVLRSNNVHCQLLAQL